jgi:hypothetical protein
MGIYTVQAGDTLSSISRRFKGDANAWRDIAASNQLADPNKLKIGQTLEIDGYEPEAAQDAGIPEPRANPRRVFQEDLGNAFRNGVTRQHTPVVSQSARAAGAEDIAIPEKPMLDDTLGGVSNWMVSEGDIGRPAPKPKPKSLYATMQDKAVDGQAQVTMAPETYTAPYEEPEDDGLLQRNPPKYTEQADPDFSVADPGPVLELTREQVMSLPVDDRNELIRILNMLREPQS